MLEVIRRAFAGVPVPDASHRTLYQAEAWDEYELVDQDKDHKGPWTTLPDADLLACQNALPHLDAHGMHYYLPAVMSHFVRTSPKRRADKWIHVSLLYRLEPSTGDLKAHQRAQFERLTHEQRKAILAFLEHIEAPEQLTRPWRRVVEAGDTPSWFRAFH